MQRTLSGTNEFKITMENKTEILPFSLPILTMNFLEKISLLDRKLLKVDMIRRMNLTMEKKKVLRQILSWVKSKIMVNTKKNYKK